MHIGLQNLATSFFAYKVSDCGIIFIFPCRVADSGIHFLFLCVVIKYGIYHYTLPYKVVDFDKQTLHYKVINFDPFCASYIVTDFGFLSCYSVGLQTLESIFPYLVESQSLVASLVQTTPSQIQQHLFFCHSG